jgi:hypothetical protein
MRHLERVNANAVLSAVMYCSGAKRSGGTREAKRAW